MPSDRDEVADKKIAILTVNMEKRERPDCF